MIEQHFRIGPSKAKQWMHCTASISYTEANRHKLPKSNSSVYSEEGTEAHEWCAKVLTGEVDIEAVPENFRPFVRTYANSCLFQFFIVIPIFVAPYDVTDGAFVDF